MGEMSDYNDWSGEMEERRKVSGWNGREKPKPPTPPESLRHKIDNFNKSNTPKKATVAELQKQIEELTKRVKHLEDNYGYQEDSINELNDWVRDVEKRVDDNEKL
jgi:uncharacterized coiled-coil protein SlyX